MFTVRPAAPTDLPAVGRLRWAWTRDELGAPSPAEQEAYGAGFLEWAARHRATHRCFVVETGGAVVGAAWLVETARVPSPDDLDRRNCEIQGVVIAPEHRGQGAGAALVDRLVAEAAQASAERLVVHSSERAVALYERAGFRSSALLLELDPRGTGAPARRPSTPAG